MSRKVTVFLLLLTTAGIAGLTLWASGKAYTKVDSEPFREIRVLKDKLSQGPLRTETIVALTMPIVLNVLLFIPWGFFAFVALDVPDRPAFLSYLWTILGAVAFSSLIEAWQYFLPTRVTDVNDIIWNAAGATVGASYGHIRKRVRVAFE
ncbi:MAG TPA: VanZ family protein [Thermoanaerobaculia bacterium]|nr:VanZ family protein [Thermoanaerobaculia bacterium]